MDRSDVFDYSYPLLRDRNGDVAELKTAGVVALDVEGPGLAFVGIDRTAGDAFDLALIDLLDAIAPLAHGAAHQGEVKAFPLSRCTGGRGHRSDTTVDGADAAFGRIGFVVDLHFIATSEIKAAIAAVWTVHFEMDFEVVERAGGLYVCAMGGVYENTVFHDPIVMSNIAERFPASEILAVEKRFGFAPCLRSRAVDCGRARAGERHLLVAA